MRYQKNKMKTFKLIILIILLLIIAINIYQNFSLKITNINYQSRKVPDEVKGFKILQISDYHNKKFLTEDYFINKVKETSPDIILLTGDIINSRSPDYDLIRATLKELLNLAPVYYSTGNHERRLTEFDDFIIEMKDMGVVVLQDEANKLKLGNSEINIIGLNDPSYYGNKHLVDKLNDLVEKDKFNILLSHRPELFKEYVNSGVDLVFSGHAHGGQVRIPFIGAIFAPNQGFLPEYTDGIYKEKETTMVVSYGIGSSLIPVRIFAKPEIILLEIN
ncbi:metallophosphoesterase [Miniphocaeibacter massiliensis]|uniref:metallophosphoesterase n=1 Tax=Miniphocaeibacter massiliensis TaxID=2041841 RepID=UPI0013EE3D20|nr:metallophosphoesterase [Miniphocaeibacter massiliensis]